MSLRLDDVTVVDPAPGGMRVLEDVAVLVEDGRITQIGIERPEAARVIDASRSIAIPGLVNAHTHAPMTLLRGYADDLPLERWLRERIWPAEAHLTAERARAGAELAILEMLAAGITAFADMYFFEDQVALAAEQAGIRCLAGFTVTDLDTPEHPAETLIDEADRFLDRWPADGGRVRGSIAPHATYTCSGQTLEACADVGERHGCRLQTHCSETRHEVYTVEGETGLRPVEHLVRHGCLGEGSVLAHCGWVTKDEVRTIAAAGASVAHCPSANMKLATGGYTPLPELLDAGVRVTLGTDGPASNNTLDILQETERAALLHDHHRWHAGAIEAEQALSMATREGADALGFEGTGRVAEGAVADLCILDASKPHMAPMHDPVSQIVYAARGGDVRTTIVGGDVLYHDGRFETLDVDRILSDARQAARSLVAAAETRS